MKALIDTNVLLDVALCRRPFVAESGAVLDQAQRGRIDGWVALHTLANFYYVFSQGSDSKPARQFVADLLRFVQVAECGTKYVERSIALPMADFEDALQCAAAFSCNAEYIITRNIADFRRSPIPAIAPEQAMRELSS